MAMVPFQAQLTLTTGYPTDGESKVWQCETIFVDNEGVFTGFDITVGDVVAVDTSMYEPGTFTFYQVTNVITPDVSNPEIELTYLEINNNSWGPPDLYSLFGFPSTIARPSPIHGLLPVVSKDTQGVSDKFTEYVQNFNFNNIVDNMSSGGGGSANKLTVTIGNEIDTEYEIQHMFGTLDVIAQVRDVATNQVVSVDIRHIDVNTTSINFFAPPPIDGYRVVIIG
jgi:hypothetical protein